MTSSYIHQKFIFFPFRFKMSLWSNQTVWRAPSSIGMKRSLQLTSSTADAIPSCTTKSSWLSLSQSSPYKILPSWTFGEGKWLCWQLQIQEQSLTKQAILWIKRTFQPSLICKRRKHGFLERQKSVGGRRVLKRHMAKKRARLGGS